MSKDVQGVQDFINLLRTMRISPDVISTREPKELLSNAKFEATPSIRLKVLLIALIGENLLNKDASFFY